MIDHEIFIKEGRKPEDLVHLKTQPFTSRTAQYCPFNIYDFHRFTPITLGIAELSRENGTIIPESIPSSFDTTSPLALDGFLEIPDVVGRGWHMFQPISFTREARGVYSTAPYVASFNYCPHLNLYASNGNGAGPVPLSEVIPICRLVRIHESEGNVQEQLMAARQLLVLRQCENLAQVRAKTAPNAFVRASNYFNNDTNILVITGNLEK